MGGLILAILVSVPLLIAPNLLMYFDVTPKVVCLLLGGAAAAVWMGYSGALARLSQHRIGRWMLVIVGAQVLSLAASTAGSTNVWLSISGTNWRRLGAATSLALILFMTAVAAYLVEHPGLIGKLRRTVAGSGIVASLYGILQYSGWDALLPTRAYHIGEGATAIVRPPSTLGYANYFAAYLLFTAFAGLWTAVEEKHRGWRVFGFIAAGLAAVGIVLSGTRAAMLGLLAGFAVFALLMQVRLPLRRAAAALCALMILLAGLYWSPWGEGLRNRARWSAEEPLGGARFLLWRDSLRMAASKPVLGYGPETFSAEFPRYQSVALARQYPDFYYESPHNMFLDALASQGAAGLVVLIGTCVLGFYAAYTVRRRAPVASASLIAMLIAACVSQQFTVFVASTALFFLVVIALAVAVGAEPGPQAGGRWRWAGLAIGIPVAAGLVLCAALLSRTDYALARCSRALDKGELSEAIAQYETARSWQVPGASSDVWFSRRLAQAAQTAQLPAVRVLAWSKSAEAALRAVHTAEDPHNAWYNLAAFRAAQNDVADTVACLRSAGTWAPNWFKPHWTLARVYSAVGRWPDAAREAALAADLDGGKNPEVTLTANEIREKIRQQ